MFVFQKIWRALLSWNTCFEILPFALLTTKCWFFNASGNSKDYIKTAKAFTKHSNKSRFHALTVFFHMTLCLKKHYFPAGNHMFKVNNRDIRSRCEIRSKLTIKTTERRQWRRSGVFIVNFEHISHLVLVVLF